MASAGDSPLCHPDHGLDCYRLVTVYHHEMPCRTCHEVRILEDADRLLEGAIRRVYG